MKVPAERFPVRRAGDPRPHIYFRVILPLPHRKCELAPTSHRLSVLRSSPVTPITILPLQIITSNTYAAWPPRRHLFYGTDSLSYECLLKKRKSRIFGDADSKNTYQHQRLQYMIRIWQLMALDCSCSPTSITGTREHALIFTNMKT